MEQDGRVGLGVVDQSVLIHAVLIGSEGHFLVKLVVGHCDRPAAHPGAPAQVAGDDLTGSVQSVEPGVVGAVITPGLACGHAHKAFAADTTEPGSADVVGFRILAEEDGLFTVDGHDNVLGIVHSHVAEEHGIGAPVVGVHRRGESGLAGGGVDVVQAIAVALLVGHVVLDPQLAGGIQGGALHRQGLAALIGDCGLAGGLASLQVIGEQSTFALVVAAHGPDGEAGADDGDIAGSGDGFIQLGSGGDGDGALRLAGDNAVFIHGGHSGVGGGPDHALIRQAPGFYFSHQLLLTAYEQVHGIDVEGHGGGFIPGDAVGLVGVRLQE